VTKAVFGKWWAGRIRLGDPVSNFFYVMKKDTFEWIEGEDMRPYVWGLLNRHPGLDFLHDSPEFQERYADTVICRILYAYDRHDLRRVYLRELRSKRPNVVETWRRLDQEDDINKIRDFFSYEHFYVVYCKFWELDSDRDFLLDREDLMKYDGHAFSRRCVERIFSESPKKFSSTIPGKMSYDDFVHLIISDEDKTSDTAIEYWFRVVDFDDDGCIRLHEMKWFFEEQEQRMECLNHETVSFSDVLCQLSDMIEPEEPGVFHLKNFLEHRTTATVFFSMLLSLHKLLEYEQRDPFALKHQQREHPDYTDWDRFCQQEYLRLAVEQDDDDEGGDGEMEGGNAFLDGG